MAALLGRTSGLVGIALLLATAPCGANGDATPPRFVIADLVPKACLENSTKTRVLVVLRDDGKLIAESPWPSHQSEIIVANMRLVLAPGGKDSFGPAPRELKVDGFRPNLTAGMLSPAWFDGAVHTYAGIATINQYQFHSDKAFPLSFKVVKGQGYVHLCGRGTVTAKGQPAIKLGDGESLEYWIARSQSEDLLDREGCAQALGYLGCAAPPQQAEKAKETLKSLLSDKSYQVRRNAIEAIVRTDASGTFAGLLKQASERDGDKWVRACAKWALEKPQGK